jgi:Protein of unknown function (DUF1629)
LQRRTFYRVNTDPYGGLESRRKIDWVMSRAGNRPGPFVAPHLPSLGIGLTSLGSGFPRDAPPDKIVYEYDSHSPLRDIEGGADVWIISDAARKVLETYAANSIDLAPAEVFIRYKGEDRPAGSRWLCDVIRFEDAVDETASQLNWLAKFPQYDPVGSKYVLKADLPPDLHLFRVWKEPGAIACSQNLRDALTAARLSGVVLTEF